MAIDGGQSRRRIAQRLNLQPNHAHYMGEPHPGGEALAGDIADGEYQICTEFKRANEIAGQVTYRENLAGDLKGPTAKKARAAEFSLHLGGFVHRASQVVLFPAQSRKLVLEHTVAARNVRKMAERSRGLGDLRPICQGLVLAPAQNL